VVRPLPTLRDLPKTGQIDVRDCTRCGEPFEQIRRGVKPFFHCEPCRAEAHADYIARKRKERARQARSEASRTARLRGLQE
jgi:hypothetical protein